MSKKHVGLIERARRFFLRTRKNTITQVALLAIISKQSGCTIESVRGTIIGGGRKLFGQASFQKDWLVCGKRNGKPKRFVRKGTEEADDIVEAIEYNTPNKIVARERGLKHLRRGRQNVITFAGAKGYCVHSIYKHCGPNVQITNIEKIPEVLAEWIAEGVPTNNFSGNFSDFVRSPEFAQKQYSLFNIDLMSYICGGRIADLLVINKLANVKYIVLTVQASKEGFRNGGAWKEEALKLYLSDDKPLECLKSVMTNYNLIDHWSYIRDPAAGSRAMRMFVLQRH